MAPTKRKIPRAGIPDHVPAAFVQCEDLSPEPLRIRDISELGARIHLHAPAPAPAPESSRTIHSANLILGPIFHCHVSIRVIHSQPGSLGLEFVGLPAIVRFLLRRYFGPELTGAALSENELSPERLCFANDSASLEVRLREGRPTGLNVRSPSVSGDIRFGGGAAAVSYPDAFGTSHHRRHAARLIANLTALRPGLRRSLVASLLGS